MSELSQEEIDEGMIAVLLERANRRIPNLLSIKERLEAGGTLSGLEITELEKMIEGASDTRALIDRHPEYQELVARMMSLYEEITEMALVNEEKGEVKPDIDLSE
jgi:dsDNA-specific endonuclease/ATPase MutS2